MSFLKLWNVRESWLSSTERRAAAIPIAAARGRRRLLLAPFLLRLLGKEALKCLRSWNECHSQARTLKEAKEIIPHVIDTALIPKDIRVKIIRAARQNTFLRID